MALRVEVQALPTPSALKRTSNLVRVVEAGANQMQLALKEKTRKLIRATTGTMCASLILKRDPDKTRNVPEKKWRT